MKKQLMNYETLLKVTNAISHSKDPEEVVLMTVEGITTALESIADSLKEGPVAIYDVSDDPRIQYPEEAQKEGIASILSVPIGMAEHVIGALRIYTSEHWEFTLDDVNFTQAMALITGMAMEMARHYKGLTDSIEID